MEEKRRNKRIILDANLAMNRIDGNKHDIVPIQVVDVSKSGVGFECARELEMNSVYELELILWTKEKINTFITVIRCDNRNNKKIYGATFVGLTEADSCKIDIYDMFNSEE
ncbi:MAG: PilZ domain-containing protein [Lachnospiraceae bacterium]|nr:PilZ domain-containing protein [Lachnospiraceae bacterium]